ncbi:hypothetical protein KC340_g11471 [Hortaea werneckii]|nr:hypothetical protein KC339_g13317 [Hortaea werneckii]KAI7206730.1 hypothetical protein KC365_g16976 [Hortaea werneckii]KAI7307283.1 hypothetical protein KC340_g11471 [Hortaea werneckii]KAI7385125.1 hypothetical protein KC328_g10469 [Hortaea werneckii]
MVIVRESPRAKVSPDKQQSQAQWPPKSPFQALLSSPSGRKRWQDRRGQARDRSLSPSPIKSSSRKLQAVAMPSDDEMDMDGGGADDDKDDDDDDEETLRLKMEAIQARLKLKALQKKKKKAEAGAEAGTGTSAERERTKARASRDTTPPPSRGRRPSASQQDLNRAPNVEVEFSPIKDHHEDPLLSPARRRLGLNSAPDASGISLKRARDGTVTQQIRRSESALAPPSARRSRDASPPKKKTKSFTERLQASRDQVEEREAKFDRMERTRSKGFSSDVSRQTPFQSTKQKLEGASGGNTGTPGEAKRPTSARDGAPSTIMPRSTARGSQPSEPSSTYISTPARFSAQVNSRAKPSKTNDTARPTSKGQQQQRLHTSADSDSDLSISGAPNSHGPTSAGRADHESTKDESNSSYDPFSELHLSKRHIPHPVVAREMNGKGIYPLPRLLKEVKAPHYDPPDCAEDFVVFGILASKSSPYDQKPQHKTTTSTGSGGGETSQEDPLPPPTGAEEALPRNKFMVLHLTDLKWELDCFLFGTAFDQFWKLVPGTLLAILNPAILPPKKPNTDTGRFSLKLGSSDDCIMEVGSARDLGFCTATRRDGRECGGWVDRRRTEVCEFHLNAFVERQRKGRMEVNTMWRGQGNEGGSGGMMKNGNVRSQAREAGGWNRDMQRRRGGGGMGGGGTQSHHREYGTLYSVPPDGGNGAGDSAASLLDAEDKLHLDSYEAGEASRKRIAAAQRERDLQRRLVAMGKGVGAEYMQASLEGSGTAGVERGKGSDPLSSHQQQQQQQHFEKPSAADLGLLGKQADTAHLSPAKDRRRHFGLGSAGMSTGTTSSTGRQDTGLGWGGARKAGLLLEQQQQQQQQQQRGQSNDNETNDAGRNPPPSAVRRRRSTQDETANWSPNKKRARFMLEDKGLREPGRDSGANELLRIGRDGGGGGGAGRDAAVDNENDDDDDGLEIV